MNKRKKRIAGIDWISLLKNNWAWAAPLCYTYATCVGMVQAWLQYSSFGINVFEFSELNDFLLAAFREPRSFWAILGLVVWGSQSYYYSKLFGNHQDDTSQISYYKLNKFLSWFLNIIGIVALILAPYYVPYLLNNGYDDDWKKSFLSDPHRTVKATFKDMAQYSTITGWVDNLVLIGTTDKYVFFFDKSNDEILIAPLSNVLLISRAELSNN